MTTRIVDNKNPKILLVMASSVRHFDLFVNNYRREGITDHGRLVYVDNRSVQGVHKVEITDVSVDYYGYSGLSDFDLQDIQARIDIGDLIEIPPPVNI